MKTIANPHLLRAMIQRTRPGVAPSRTITAPEPCERASLITEDERLATFERSRTFHATSPTPATHPPMAQGLGGVASHRFHYAD